MKTFALSALFISSLSFGQGKTTKIEETITIKSGTEEKPLKETKFFCAQDKKEAEKQCTSWLTEQKKRLGQRLLTSHCSDAKFLYGKETEGCMAFLSEGEVSFVIK